MLVVALFMPALSLFVAIWWYNQIEPTLDAEGNRVAVQRDAMPLLAIFVGAAGMIGCIAYHDYMRPPLKVVAAAPFPSFAGCPIDRARNSHYVPQTCVDYHYAIDDYYDLGLSDPEKGTDWYRVGDDALLLSCFSDRAKPCHVEKGVLNIYARPRSTTKRFPRK